MHPKPTHGPTEAGPIISIPEEEIEPNKISTIKTIIDSKEGEEFHKRYPLTNQTKALDIPNTFTPSYSVLWSHGREVKVDYISERDFRFTFSAH